MTDAQKATMRCLRKTLAWANVQCDRANRAKAITTNTHKRAHLAGVIDAQARLIHKMEYTIGKCGESREAQGQLPSDAEIEKNADEWASHGGDNPVNIQLKETYETGANFVIEWLRKKGGEWLL
jgi:hypothetical protein